MLVDLVSKYNGKKLSNSRQKQIRMKSFFVLSASAGQAVAILKMIDSLFD